MKLIDSSAWVHALRPTGDPGVKARVRVLLQSGEAAWCAMVRLELWNGARGQHEQRVLAEMERDLPDLEINSDVWRVANDLARAARAAGQTIPPTDILIAACARHHRVEIEHADDHLGALSAL